MTNKATSTSNNTKKANNSKTISNSPKANKFLMILVFIVIYLISGVFIIYVNKLIDQYLFKYNTEDNEKNNTMVLYLNVLIEIMVLIIIFAIYLYIIKQIAISLKLDKYNFMTSFVSFIFFTIIIINLFKPYIFKDSDILSEDEDSYSNLNKRLLIVINIVMNTRKEKVEKKEVEITDPNYNMKSWKSINNREYIFDRDTKNHLNTMLHQNKIRNNKIKESKNIDNLNIPFHKKYHKHRSSKSSSNNYSFRDSYPDYLLTPKENIYYQDS